MTTSPSVDDLKTRIRATFDALHSWRLDSGITDGQDRALLVFVDALDHAMTQYVATVEARPRRWDAAILYAPFTPDGNGGNDGIVRDANGGFVADTRGFEARADVIAEVLSRAARPITEEGSK